MPGDDDAPDPDLPVPDETPDMGQGFPTDVLKYPSQYLLISYSAPRVYSVRILILKILSMIASHYGVSDHVQAPGVRTEVLRLE